VTHEQHPALREVRLAIFDADDTLRRTLVPGQPCPRAPHEWELLPGVRRVLSTTSWQSGRRIAIASNQDQVGYGLLTVEMAERLLLDLVREATAGRGRSPIIRFCAHRLEQSCRCRKPEPGMLLDLMREAGEPPHATLFVGNAESDREAARRAGVRFAWAAEFFAHRSPA
jgi:D-glycero-D-manno-heptose 1,7-bisphosphate phosphatase